MLSRGVGTALDTKLLHGADKAIARRRDANGAHQAGLVRIDLVGGTGDVIRARGPQVADNGIDLDRRILGAQAADLVVDIA
ncbi:hypothetical protein D3C75_1084510 [compost metagenome]